MDELFNLLSSSARIDKTKRKKRKPPRLLTIEPSISSTINVPPSFAEQAVNNNQEEDADSDDASSVADGGGRKRKRKQHSKSKLAHMHTEQVSAFRRRMNIRIRDGNSSSTVPTPDPLCSFDGLAPPAWWNNSNSNNNIEHHFQALKLALLCNIASEDGGKWIHPTPIQMQAVPSLFHRRDTLGCAPTGSGKSGAFLIPLLLLARVDERTFYYASDPQKNADNYDNDNPSNNNNNTNKKNLNDKKNNCQGHIRALVLAPSRELAHQLHRETERLGENMGVRAALLSKANAGTMATLGGKRGLDVLVATPLRLVDALSKKLLDLSRVRIVVLDEADRLLDASEHNHTVKQNNKNKNNQEETTQQETSGSVYADTFLEQIDSILAAVPPTAVRSLFSATIGSSVRTLAESFLRNPVDITVGSSSSGGGALANPDIDQRLLFVGREEGKLLAIRQIIQQGINPPVIIFLQSKDRAQALYGELLYDGVNVDVIHAGRTQGARDQTVAKFRKGEVWVLICTDLVARGVDFKGVNMVINYDLPESGVTYVHRIGRTGRAGRKGEAVTLYTEADFEHVGTIANVMKLSGCDTVPAWLLRATASVHNDNNKKKKKKRKMTIPPKRMKISTTPRYDVLNNKKHKKRGGTKERKHGGGHS